MFVVVLVSGLWVCGSGSHSPKENESILVIHKKEIDKIGKEIENKKLETETRELDRLLEIFYRGKEIPKLLEIRCQPIRNKKEGSYVFLSPTGTGNIQNVTKYQGCMKLSKFLFNMNEYWFR